MDAWTWLFKFHIDPMCIQGPTPVAEALSALIPGIVSRNPSLDGLDLGLSKID